MTVRAKLTLGALASAGGALLVCLALDLASTKRLLEGKQRELEEQAVRRLIEVSMIGAEQGNDIAVLRHMKATAGSPGVLYLAVTDSENRVRVHSDLLRGERGALGRPWRSMPEEERQSVRASDLMLLGREVREWSGPVPLKGPWHGMVYVGYDRVVSRRQLAGELGKAAKAPLAAFIPIAALVVGLAQLLAAQLERRVKGLAEVARSLGSGAIGEARAPVSTDELGDLASALNGMAEGLKRSQDLREESLASIAHDLKAPLANILAFTQLLREQAKGRLLAEDVGCLVSIVSIAQRMSIMIQEILDIARLRAGQTVMRKSPTAVADLAREALKVIEPTARGLGVQIGVDIAPDVPAMLVDPLLIVRVLVNLLANALRFTPQGGHVGIKATLRRRSVEVLVSDNGTGIAPEQLPTLFTRFRQVPETMGAARQAVGTGLGLAVCKAIITAHGGDIWVQGPAEGGTVIGFALPIR